MFENIIYYAFNHIVFFSINIYLDYMLL